MMTMPHAVPVASLIVAIVGLTNRADAQAAGPSRWAIGLTGMIAGQPLAMGSLGIGASRVIVSKGAWGFRLDGTVFTAVHYQKPDLCFGFGPCDTRATSQLGTLTGTATIGSAARGIGRGIYALVGAGVYGTRWRGGTYTPAQGTVPAVEAAGAGPSGLAIEGGLGYRIPALRGHFRIEMRAHRFQHAANDDAGGLSMGVSRAW